MGSWYIDGICTVNDNKVAPLASCPGFQPVFYGVQFFESPLRFITDGRKYALVDKQLNVYRWRCLGENKNEIIDKIGMFCGAI